MLSKICILYTGGTIGMDYQIPGDANSPLIAQDLSYLLDKFSLFSEQTLKLANGNRIEFTIEQLMMVDSTLITPQHWQLIAKRIGEIYHDYQGFVLLHGTDTMAYTASALAFACENLQKPIVLTGAQKPLGDLRSDGKSNLINAMLIAAGQVVNLTSLPEVVVVFADGIYRGCRCSKFAIEDFHAFTSTNYPPLGKIASSISIEQSLLLPLANKQADFVVKPDFAAQVHQIYFTPGISMETVEELLMSPRIKAYILRSYGCGNIPTDDILIKSLKNAINSGKIMVNLSQCPSGGVVMSNYATGAYLRDLGVISAGDMTVEAATGKLMWLLANYPIEQIAQLMTTSLRGELSNSHSYNNH